MAPFLKGFRWNLFNFLKQFNENKEIILPIPQNLKDDLQICFRIIQQAAIELPIASPSYDAPEGCFNFVSDAAGRRDPMTEQV